MWTWVVFLAVVGAVPRKNGVPVLHLRNNDVIENVDVDLGRAIPTPPPIQAVLRPTEPESNPINATGTDHVSYPMESKPRSSYIRDEQLGKQDRGCIPEGSTLSHDGFIHRPNITTSQFGLQPSIVDFNVVSWNLFLRQRQLYDDAQLSRADAAITALFSRIPEGDADVLVFQEVFDLESRLVILSQLASRGWVYATKVQATQGAVKLRSNGGLLIVSRWPIEAELQSFFPCALYSDALTDTGVVYVRVQKIQNGQAKKFNIFATHLQSSESARPEQQLEEVRTRLCQARRLKEFIASVKIPTSEPIIVAGDMNIDILNNAAPFTQEIFNFTGTVGLIMPTFGGPQFSSFSPDNELVGRDGSADQFGCGAECELLQDCHCIPPMWLDYIFFARGHQAPIHASALYSLDIVVSKPIQVQMSQSSSLTTPSKPVERELRHVSDHNAVVRLMTFIP